MRWFLYILAVIVLFNLTAPGTALILSAALLAFIWPRVQQKTPAPNLPPALQNLARLSLLRHYIIHAKTRDTLDDARRQKLLRQIEHTEAHIFSWRPPVAENKDPELNAAWDYLVKHSTAELGLPPWENQDTGWEEQSVAPAERREIHQAGEQPQISMPPVMAEKTPPPSPSFKPESNDLDSRLRGNDGIKSKPVPPPKPATPSKPTWHDHAQTFMRNILLPFLWQNIGWFIGGFMFISGSIFLVAYTSGFTKALAVTGTLALYIALLLWGAYQLRKKRPELVAASSVLLTLAALLIPLDIAAALRMGTNAALLPQLTALGLALLLVAVFAYAMRLASGIMDRSLIREQPDFFIFLSGIQIGVLALPILPWWPVLAVLHLSILALLAYALYRFAEHWLQAIFIDKRMLAYYAVGTLIYAAVVSFVHLTWAAPYALPAGYAGPFLIALCALLLYADSHFQRWRNAHVWLNYFSFVIYALSVVAVVLSWQGGVNPVLLLTLALATLLYGVMVWQYLSLPPLTLFLASAGGLYALTILRPFPEHWHFLLSLPGFIALLQLQKFAYKRNSAALAKFIYAFSLIAATVLVGWSLFFGTPGIPSMLTPLSAALMMVYLLGLTPKTVFQTVARDSVQNDANDAGAEHFDKLNAPSRAPICYMIPALVLLTFAYAPLILSANWFVQFPLALLTISAVSGAWGVFVLRHGLVLCQAAVWINSALLNLVLALGLALYGTSLTFWPWLFGMAALILLGFSLALNARPLLYLALLSSAVSAGLVKWLYFPAQSSGLVEMTLVLGLWALWWWLSWYQPEESAPAPRRGYLYRAAVPQRGLRARADMALPPVAVASFFVWLWGLINISVMFFTDGNFSVIAISALIGALATGLIAGQSRTLFLLPLAFALGLCAVIGVSAIPTNNVWSGFFTLTSVYSIAAWLLFAWWLRPPLRWTRLLGWRDGYAGGRANAVLWLHGSVLLTLALTVALLLLNLAGLRELAWLPYQTAFISVAAALIFFIITGFNRHWLVYSYISLALAAVLGVLFTSWHNAVPLTLVSTLPNLPLERAVLVVVLVLLAYWLRSLIVWKRGYNPELAHDPVSPRLPNPAPFPELVEGGRGALARLADLYAAPLYHAALLVFAYTLLDALWRFGTIWFGGAEANPWLPWTFVALIPGLLLLTLDWTHAVRIRGILLPILLSLAWAGLLPHHVTAPDTLMLWGFGLWAMGMYVVPLVNRNWPRWAIEPLFCRAAGVLSYAWAVLATVALVTDQWSGQITLLHVTLLVALALASLPLLSGWSWAAAVRGVLVPSLLTLAFVAFLRSLSSGDNATLGLLLLQLWGMGLWAAAHWLLPPFNHRWPRWAIETAPWPYLGLLLVVGCSGFDIVQSGSLHASILFALAAYLGLMLYSTGWRWTAWGGVAALNLAGLVVLFEWWPWTFESQALLFMLAAIVWQMALLSVVPVWQSVEATNPPQFPFSKGGGWQRLRAPLYYLPLAVLLLALAGLSLYSAALWLDVTPFLNAGREWLVSLVLTLAFGYALWLYRRAHAAHFMWLAAWGLALQLLSGFGVAFSAALWTVILIGLVLTLRRLGCVPAFNSAGAEHFDKLNPRATLVNLLERAGWVWLSLGILVALLATFLLDGSGAGERLVTTLLIAASALIGGIFINSDKAARWWLLTSSLLGLFLIHAVWLYWLPQAEFASLLPWYALQAVVLANLNIYLTPPAWLPQRLLAARKRSGLALLTLAALFWLAHFILVIGGEAAPMFGDFGNLAAMLALLLLVSGHWPQVENHEHKIYLTALLFALLGVYARLLWLGTAPLNVWDTALLMSAAYALLAMQHAWPSPALYRLTLLVPALALLTVPLAASHASLALLASGAVYLLTRREAEQNLPVYLGLLALNAAAYLWIPAVVENTGLLQLYTVPAALTVLLMLQLHWIELRPGVAHGVRLIALTTLYASATLDVFLRPELSIFILALLISLVGVVLGIVLRVRAFLYAGTVFLVLNVVGQLVQFYPEATLGKAIVLMVLGGLITAGMIGFNMQREAIMRRLNLVRADLAAWD
jgi:hypothetical protein